MHKPVVPIQVKALVPTGNGCAVFLGNDDKTFVIYVDPSVGGAIGMFISNIRKERPLTHDLIGLILAAFGAKVERIVINAVDGGTFYGRLILQAENEIQQKKIIELDARPSDCIALAVAQKAPIYVSETVWEEVEDMSEILQKLTKAQEDLKLSEEDFDDEEEDEDDDDADDHS